MFASIAPSYDLNNRLHSLGMDQRWRRVAVTATHPRQNDRVLDVACGTGDLAEAFALAGCSNVTGVDFTEEMLHFARQKAAKPGRDARIASIAYVLGDAMALPFADSSFDIVSIAFGIRNVADPRLALRELRRVLSPARGRLVILEFAEPSFPPARWLNAVYCRGIMPRTAAWISGDRSGAYRYLPKSVRTFVDPQVLEAMLKAAGFSRVVQTSLTLGICRCYIAHV